LDANGQLDPRLRRVLVLANPRAGSERSGHVLDELVSALRARGLTPTVCWQLDELSQRVAGAEGVRCVVAAGGDGTLLEVVNRAPHLPAAVLPLGNENLVARYCGVGRSGRAAAEVIAAGRVRRLDLARVNGRLFCLMASAGFDADVVHRVHRKRRGHINRLTYAVPVARAACSYPFPPMDVEVEDTGERLRGSQVLLFNLPCYGGGLRIAPEARPDDGLLDLCVFERPGPLHLGRYLLAVVMGRQGKVADLQRRRVRRVRLSAGRPVPLQADGDPAGALPAAVEVVPGALNLVVAPSEPRP